MTFQDEVEKVIVPHGVSSDKLLRDLNKFLVELYIRGVRHGAKLGGLTEDSAYYESGLANLESMIKRVEKTKSAIEE